MICNTDMLIDPIPLSVMLPEAGDINGFAFPGCNELSFIICQDNVMGIIQRQLRQLGNNKKCLVVSEKNRAALDAKIEAQKNYTGVIPRTNLLEIHIALSRYASAFESVKPDKISQICVSSDPIGTVHTLRLSMPDRLENIAGRQIYHLLPYPKVGHLKKLMREKSVPSVPAVKRTMWLLFSPDEQEQIEEAGWDQSQEAEQRSVRSYCVIS